MKAESFKKRRNHILAVALSAMLVTVTGCGDGDSKDTSNLTEAKLKTGLTTGLTKGATSNLSAVGQVLQNSKALQEVQDRASLVQTKTVSRSKAFGDGLGFGSNSDGLDPLKLANDTLELIDDLINQSSVSQSGNVYTFDPNETAICADPELRLDAAAVTSCTQILAHITFVVTINATAGDEVTAADTAFKFDDSTFATTGFTPTNDFYEVDFGGLKPVLTALKDLDPEASDFDVPQTMSGKLRTNFATPDENSGSITVLIPEEIRLVSTVPGEEVNLTLGTTEKLFMMSANAATNALELEIGLGALNAIYTDSDATGSFPVELALKAVTGKLAITENGDDVQITGLGMNTVTLKVDSLDALLINLPELDALLDASGLNAFVRLDEDLNFSFNKTNVRQYFDKEAPATDFTNTSITAPAGTVLTETSETTAIAVTGGPLAVTIDENGTSQSAVVPTDSCLDTTLIQEIACPNSGS